MNTPVSVFRFGCVMFIGGRFSFHCPMFVRSLHALKSVFHFILNFHLPTPPPPHPVLSRGLCLASVCPHLSLLFYVPPLPSPHSPGNTLGVTRNLKEDHSLIFPPKRLLFWVPVPPQGPQADCGCLEPRQRVSVENALCTEPEMKATCWYLVCK